MNKIIITIEIELHEELNDETIEKLNDEIDLICDKVLHRHDVIKSSFEIIRG